MTCLHTNALKFYSLLLNFGKITIQYGNYEEIPTWKENYGEFTYVLRYLTKYSWWIHLPPSASIILHSWFKELLAIGHLVNSCDTINTETDSMAEANSFNTDLPTNILPTELANELINDGLRQFWEILLTSKDSDMQKMSRDVLNGYYWHLPELSKEHEFIKATSGRITKFLKTTDTEKLSKLRELQSIVCLLLHHIQQSYKKYAFHIRLSALKQGSAPIDSHFINHGLLVRTAFQASDWEKSEEKRRRLP